MGSNIYLMQHNIFKFRFERVGIIGKSGKEWARVRKSVEECRRVRGGEANSEGRKKEVL